MKLEISKDNDLVWQVLLLSKVPFFGFPPFLHLLMSSFLSFRSISELLGGAISSSFPVNYALPRGSILSPVYY